VKVPQNSLISWIQLISPAAANMQQRRNTEWCVLKTMRNSLGVISIDVLKVAESISLKSML